MSNSQSKLVSHSRNTIKLKLLFLNNTAFFEQRQTGVHGTWQLEIKQTFDAFHLKNDHIKLFDNIAKQLLSNTLNTAEVLIKM